MKKSISILVILALFASACTKKQNVTDKVLNIAVPAKVKGMDPIYANDRYSSNEISRVYEGLLEFHYLKRPYTLTPNLAEAMPKVSDDGLTYTFKIKKGVLFHDDAAFPGGKGREVTAQDFVYSFKRVADPKLQSTGWWMFEGKIVGLNEWREANSNSDAVDYSTEIEGLKAVDKYTLQFKLSKPFPQFLYGLAMPFAFVVAKEAVEKYGREFLNHPVGTGPFVLPVFNQSNKIVYTKNPNFREKFYPKEASDEFKNAGMLDDAGKKLPLVNKVVVNIMTEESARWLNFKKGKLDYLQVPKDNFETAVTPSKGLAPEFKEKGIELQIRPSLDVTYIAFNHHHTFLQNKKLRQAMSLAYDGEKAIELFYNSNALLAQSVVPPGIAGHIEGYENPYKKNDLEKAKKLLAEAGYPDGKGLKEINYDTTAATTSDQMAQYFKKEMAKIGINIKINLNQWPDLQKKIANKTAELYGIAWGADYPDAENFLQLLYGPNKTPGANGSNYDNPEFNQLFKTAALMQDTPERTALYEKLYRIAAEEVPWIYGVHRQTFDLNHGWLKNYIRSDFDQGQAQYLNVDLKAKSELLEKF